MPINLILAGKVIKDMMEADKNNERAERVTLKAANQQFAAETEEQATQKLLNNSTAKLANRKRAILKTSFPKFTAVYSEIMKIQFDSDTRGIKELFDLQNMQVYNSYISEINAIEPMKLTDRQLTSSFLVSGAPGLLFGAPGFIALGAAGSIRKESELNVTTANARKKQANIYAEAVAAKKDALEAVCWHLDQVSDVLAKLNALFLRSIKTSSAIIACNGYSSLNYSDNDLTYIGTCMNLAKAVKAILDAPILDEKNQVISTAKDIIVTGQTYVEQFSQLL